MMSGSFTRTIRRRPTAAIGAVIAICFFVLALVGPFVAPRDPLDPSLGDRLQGPSSASWMGTDELGRDTFSRLLYGARFSLGIAFVATLFGAVTGVVVGMLAGYAGGSVDQFAMRVTDVQLALPSILLALTLVAALGTSVITLMIAIGIGSMPNFARLARGSTLTVRGMDFVEAARAVGASHSLILRRYIAPNIAAPLIVEFTLRFSTAILVIGGLSFLGLGVQAPAPEWGAMLSVARSFLDVAPYMAVFPGLAIFLAVLGLNLLGDGLRDALDPRMRR